MRIWFFLIWLLPLLAFSCKKKANESDIKVDRWGVDPASFTRIATFAKEVNLNLASFQIRPVGNGLTDQCYFPGTSGASYDLCDGLAHWIVDDLCKEPNTENAYRYKLRFQANGPNICLNVIEGKPQMDACRSVGNKAAAWVNVNEVLSCDHGDLAGHPYISVEPGGDSHLLTGPDRKNEKLSVNFYRAAKHFSPQDIGIGAGIGWKKASLKDLHVDYIAHATRIIENLEYTVAYSEMAPSLELQDIKLEITNKKQGEEQKHTYAWFRDNLPQCHDMCNTYNGRICSGFTRERRGLKKWFDSASCAVNKYKYETQNITLDRVKVPQKITFIYKKTAKKNDPQNLLGISIDYKIDNNSVSTEHIGKKTTYNSTTKTSTFEFTTDSPDDYLKKAYISTGDGPGVGAITFETAKKQLWKVDGTGKYEVALNTVSKALRPLDLRGTKVCKPKQENNEGTADKLNTTLVLLDGNEGFTEDERVLICKFADQDITDRKFLEQKITGHSYDDIMLDWAKQLIELFQEVDQDIENIGREELAADLNINWNPSIVGFYGFVTDEGIASLGVINADTEYTKAVASHIIKGEAKGGMAEERRELRSFKQRDTMLQTRGISFHGRLERIKAVISNNSAQRIPGHREIKNNYNYSQLDLSFDMKEVNNAAGSNLDAGERFSFLENSRSEATPQEYEIPADYYLCRVDYREWPKLKFTATGGRNSAGFNTISAAPNTGAIHGLKFFFAKRSEDGKFNNEEMLVIEPGAGEKDLDNYYANDQDQKTWQTLFPEEQPGDGCPKDSNNYVVGFHGEIALANNDAPETINKLGVFYKNMDDNSN